jgi:hypothetical protein
MANGDKDCIATKLNLERKSPEPPLMVDLMSSLYLDSVARASDL